MRFTTRLLATSAALALAIHPALALPPAPSIPAPQAGTTKGTFAAGNDSRFSAPVGSPGSPALRCSTGAGSLDVACGHGASGLYLAPGDPIDSSTVLQAGAGAVLGTLDQQIRAQPIYGWQFGITAGSGVSAAAANSAGFANALAALNNRGGGDLILPCGDIYVSQPVDNQYSRINVLGCGLSTFHDGGTSLGAQYGTRVLPTVNPLDANGAQTGVLRLRTPYGAANSKNAGGGFQNIAVDANGVANRLLDIDSVSFCKVRVYLADAIGTEAALVHNGVGGVNMGEAPDTQNCDIDVTGRQIDTAAAQLADIIRLDGSSNGNTSMNRIRIRGEYALGNALTAVNADNNIIDLNAQPTNNTASGGYLAYMYGVGQPTTGHAHGVDGVGVPYASSAGGSSNTFRYLHGGKSYAQGTDTPGVVVPSNNIVQILDTANGTPQPTAGAGSSWPVMENLYGTQSYGTFNNETVLADSLATARSARAANPGASVVIGNTSQAHVVLTDLTNTWLMRVLAGGIDFTQTAGANGNTNGTITVPSLSARGGLSGGGLNIAPGSADHYLYNQNGSLILRAGAGGNDSYYTFGQNGLFQAPNLGGGSVSVDPTNSDINLYDQNNGTLIVRVGSKNNDTYFSYNPNGNFSAPALIGNTVAAGGSSVSGATLTVQNTAASCAHTPTTASETVSCSSDKRLKRKIREARSALDWLTSFHVREFETIKDGSEHTGVIAQEVQVAHPELVHELGSKCEGIGSARPGCVPLLAVEQPDVWKVLEVEQELFGLIKILAGICGALIMICGWLAIRILRSPRPAC